MFDIRQSYNQSGFVILPGIIPGRLCKNLIDEFKIQIKDSDYKFLRQSTLKNEIHQFNDFGLMTNPLLNIQFLENSCFSGFKSSFFDVFKHSPLLNCFQEILNDVPVMFESMYFESSRGTDSHVDEQFFKSSQSGGMIGCWVALEDIDTSSGALYVYQYSHLLENNENVEIKRLLEEYLGISNLVLKNYNEQKVRFALNQVLKSKRVLNKIISLSGLQCNYLNYNKGDVIIFHPKLIHGSPKPLGNKSRNSITAHFLGRKQNLIRNGLHFEPLDVVDENGVLVHNVPHEL